MAKCQHCNSEHGPEDYARGFFILPDGSVGVVEGEGAVMKFARENKQQVFWNRASLESEMAARKLPLPAPGTLEG